MSSPVETAPVKPVEAATSAPEVEGHRVYVGNLAFNATEEQVREHFAKVDGEILSVVLPTRFKSRRPAGYAFVTYKTEEEAKAVVEKLNDTEIGGRKVSLEVARTREENAERKASIVEKRKEAKEVTKTETAGETTAVESEAKSDDKPKKKKAAKKTSRRRLPEEGEETAVEEIIEADESEVVKPKKTRAKREPRIDQEGEAPEAERKPKERKPKLQLTGEVSKNTVFVANLPFTVDDEALTTLFTDLSIKVKSAHVIHGLRRLPGRRPFRGSKGFGFVELEDTTQQQEAVEKINGSAVGDRKITAKIAQEMKPIEAEAVAAESTA